MEKLDEVSEILEKRDIQVAETYRIENSRVYELEGDKLSWNDLTDIGDKTEAKDLGEYPEEDKYFLAYRP